SHEYLWKCIHNTFRVGDFWSYIDTLEIQRRCYMCDVPETLEHIAMECSAPERKFQLFAEHRARPFFFVSFHEISSCELNSQPLPLKVSSLNSDREYGCLDVARFLQTGSN
ncbi:hypothetical protein K438DRAFT_1620239, partial [Mycena galopus ATCC 62051]